LRLESRETKELVTNCDRFKHFKYLSDNPLVFTEYGTIQAANVINSERAIKISVLVVRAFVQMREIMLEHQEIMQRIDNLERNYDQQFKIVFDALRELMTPPPKPRRRIGF
jgi:hypothetical protein